MDLYLVILRLIHIVAGVFWAGAAFFNVLLLEPAINASGPEGQKTMGALQRLGMVMALTVAGALTILSGLLLYGRDSGGFQMSWMASPQGAVFTLGALAGIVGGALGGSMVGGGARRLGELGAAVAQAGGKPTDEQAAQMASLKNRIHVGGQLNAALLLIAVMCMAIAPELLAR